MEDDLPNNYVADLPADSPANNPMFLCFMIFFKNREERKESQVSIL